MANYTTTAFMGLQLPIPGIQTGTLYGTQQNSAFTTIDSHNHAPGSGVQIGTLGINIDADLSYNSLFNLTNLRSARFTSQNAALALATDVNCLYVVSGDLFYNDINGNQIRLTIAGAIDVSTSGNISGMGATTASVVYTSINSTFTFNSNTLTPAKMKFGPIQIGENVTSTNYITLTPYPSLSASYTLTLPSNLPGLRTAILGVDVTGQMLNLLTDNATIILSSNLLSVGPSSLDTSYLSASANILGSQLSASANILGSQLSASAAIIGTQLSASANILGSQLSVAAGIVNSQIADNTIAMVKLASLGQQVTSSSGAFASSSSGFVNVTNLAVTITSYGRPVMLLLQGDGTTNDVGFQVNNGSTSAQLAFVRTAGSATVGGAALGLPSSYGSQVTPLMCIDPVAAGTNTYTVKVKVNAGPGAVLVSYMKLVAFEL